MKKITLTFIAVIIFVGSFTFTTHTTHAATTEDYLDGLSGTPNVSVQKSGTAKKIVVSGTLTQIGQDDIGGRWTRTVYYRQRSSKENPSDADTSSHQNSCKVGDDISSSTAQNHFVCTIDGLADDTYYFRIGSNGKATTWTAYMHTPMAVVVSDSTLDTTGGDKTGDTSALAGVNGETYQIPNQPIVGTLGSVSGAPTANTITVTLKVANPTDGAYYRLFLGKSADMKGTSCTQFEDGSEHQAESADLSKKLLQFDETWTQNITDGIYCIGLSRTADGSKKTVVASFPAGIVTIGATNIPANTDAPPPINQYGCQSTDNNSYCMISPLPGLGDDTGKVDTKQGIEKYIKGIIQLVIGIIGVLAVLMIVVGGIEYMSTVSIGEKEGAKSRITNALIGLLLALSSYTILNTINPDLVNLKIHLPEAALKYEDSEQDITFADGSVDSSTVSNVSGITVPTGDAKTLANQIISSTAISFNALQDEPAAQSRQNIVDTAAGKPASTSTRSPVGVTQVALNAKMLAGIIAVAEKYTIQVNEITGGVHSANSRHYAGDAFDIQSDATDMTKVKTIESICQQAGATEIIGPCNSYAEKTCSTTGFKTRIDHATHIHCAWPR